MEDYIIRQATIDDVPFLVETIIAAEKSGSDKLSYSTIFGLTEQESKKYIADMLLEEVDNCELSISSFLVAEVDGQVVAAVSGWVEGIDGIPSSVIKGNLLNFTLPKKCIEQATALNPIIREIHIEYAPNSIQLGYAYVLNSFRGKYVIGVLTDKVIEHLLTRKPDVTEAYAQVFENNTPSIRTCEKQQFKQFMIKRSSNSEILNYLPYHSKVLMKKEISSQIKL